MCVAFAIKCLKTITLTWIALYKTVIDYAISFNRYFYQHKPMCSLEVLTREILALEAKTEGLLKQLVSFVGVAV